jgi:hypothetical protein
VQLLQDARSTTTNVAGTALALNVILDRDVGQGAAIAHKTMRRWEAILARARHRPSTARRLDHRI